MIRALTAALLLAGCSQPKPTEAPANTPAGDLERAAIAAGVIPDPADTDLTGLYARDTDRVCIVPDATGYRIGAFIDYGDSQTCSATGKVARDGESLKVDFGNDCKFDARFDGDGIAFAGDVPDACRKLCGGHASLAALEAARLSESVSEASTLRDASGRMLCGG